MNNTLPGPGYFVIFGSIGDLSRRKRLPALYPLEAAGGFDDDLRFVAFARCRWDFSGWLSTAYRNDHELSLGAYQTLLLDIIEGDRSLFIRFHEVERAWRVNDPILRHWQKQRSHSYLPRRQLGSRGSEPSVRLRGA